MDQPTSLVCWLLDTRALWDEGERIEQTSAAPLLPLLSPAEHEAVTRKHFLRDARMSLASALLKRAFVAHRLHVPWRGIAFARAPDPVHGKPCYVESGTGKKVEGVVFNVSHQAGLVGLVGWAAVPDGKVTSDGATSGGSATAGGGGAGKEMEVEVDLGIDVVCVNERNDYRTIDNSPTGFAAWLEIYEDFFSPADLEAMNTLPADTLLYLPDNTVVAASALTLETLRCCRRGVGLTARVGGEGGGKEKGSGGEERAVHFQSDVLVEEKLRLFYTFWCLKEAFIKLTGEAMLAPWLREVEFKNVRAPRAAATLRAKATSPWGEKVEGIQVYLHGKRVEDVTLWIQAFEEDYMVAVAVRGVPGHEETVQEVKRVALGDVLGFGGVS